MNIQHIWSVLCKESVINKDDNNISIHGVLEELAITVTDRKREGKRPEKFSIPLHYEIVSLWTKEKNTRQVVGDIEYTLIDPDSVELLKTSQEIVVPENIRRHRTRMKIAGIVITKEGDYRFRLRFREEGNTSFNVIGELPLEVNISSDSPRNTDSSN